MIKIYNSKIEKNITNQMYDILINNLFITHPEFLKNREKHDNLSNKTKWINIINTTPDYNVITYVENNELLGFLNYCIIENELWISEVQIKDEYKNKGILKKLLKYFINLDIINEYKYIIIHINDDNEISKKVFKHIGFKEIGNTLYKINTDTLISWLK